ncbi:hypothetical protein RUND412_007926 [Rhizina undulata]
MISSRSILRVVLLLQFTTFLSASPIIPSTPDDLELPLPQHSYHPSPAASSPHMPTATPYHETFVEESDLEPRTDCENSGIGNTGCNNSGIGNSGTSNSGIGNCGVNLSGVGEGCSSSAYADSAGTGTATAAADVYYTTTLTGPTSTVTVVVNGRNRRTDCAYWRAQGYTCSGAAESFGGRNWGLLAAAWGVWAVVGGAVIL